MEVTHDWAFTYINIALGNAVEKFNQSLVPVFNQTGEGTFCLPSAGGNVLAEIGAAEGVNATLQVIQLSMTGNALYNVSGPNENEFGVMMMMVMMMTTVMIVMLKWYRTNLGIWLM